MSEVGFWRGRSLDSFTPDEWESLCDGCGLCCLHKLEDEDTDEVFYTRVACRILNIEQRRCSDYSHRFSQVPSCIKVTPELALAGTGLPRSCAYRLLANGEPLPETHPLNLNEKRSSSVMANRDDDTNIGDVGSLSEWAVSEEYIHPDEMQEHVIHWVEQ